MPARYDNVCAGGGGRYLVFRFDALHKLAVFDTSAAKIIGYVPFDGDCLCAAGAEKLVAVNPAKYVIERFDLKTQKLEATQPLPEVGRTGLILAMGAASHGPVFVGAGQGPIGSQVVLLDLDTLKPIDCTMPAQSVAIYPQSQVRAAADGRTFALWQANNQQGGPQILVFDNAGQNLVVRKDSQQGGPQVLVFDGRELARTRGNAINGWLLPGETGDRIYSQEGGIYSNQLKRLDTLTPVNINPGPAIPAVEGPFWVRVHLKVPGANSGPQSGAVGRRVPGRRNATLGDAGGAFRR